MKRERSEEDRRVVYSAYGKGRESFYHHEQFHRQMTNAVIEKLDDEEIDALVKCLKIFLHFSEVISHKQGKREI